MGRISNAQAIVVESAIFRYVSRVIDIAVVERIIRIIPVSIEKFQQYQLPARGSLLTFYRIQSHGSEFAK